MRDLNYAIDCDDTKLAKDIKALLKEAIKDDKENLTSQQREVLKAQYDKTLQHLLTMLVRELSDTLKSNKKYLVNLSHLMVQKIMLILGLLLIPLEKEA